MLAFYGLKSAVIQNKPTRVSVNPLAPTVAIWVQL